MSTVAITEQKLREAMRDRRYWQSGHAERDDYGRWVTEGFEALVAAEQGGAGGTIEVQVSPYTRVRDGQTERVDGYVQKRRAARQTAAPRQDRSDPSTVPEAPARRASVTLVAFFGGFADRWTGVVGDFAERYASANRHHLVGRYPHDEYEAPIRAIAALPADARVVFIGHSWGASTAARVAATLGASGRSIDLLVTVDPVSANATADMMTEVRAGTRQWINVRAAGGGRLNASNLIARVGGRFGDLPEGFADTHIRAPLAHEAFERMLLLKDASGRSALDAVLSE